MKQRLATLLLLLTISTCAFAQDKVSNSRRFQVGGTPILAFDSDLGTRYGGLANLFDYGTTSTFPNYQQLLKVRGFNTTKGTASLSFIYENLRSKDRIISAEATFSQDVLLDFYGFNGLQAPIIYDYTKEGSATYINRYYYRHHRSLYRLKFDIFQRLYGNHLMFYGGAMLNKISVADIAYEKMNITVPQKQVSLYKHYVDNGIIDPSEKGGGTYGFTMLGASFDSRDSRVNTTAGIWLESYFVNGISISGKGAFSRQITSFRHYFQINRPRLLVSYQLSSQQLLAGRIPFYLLPFVYDTRQIQDGLGGAFNLRGAFRNRVAANGFVLTNLEVRKSTTSFKLLKQHWEIYASIFSDGAIITQPYSKGLQVKDFSEIKRHYSAPFVTLGTGLYLVYGANNVLSVNVALPTNRQAGRASIYVGSSFLF